MQNVEVPIKLLSTIGGDATFQVSRRQGGEIGRGGGREDIVAVGREGVACRGRRERKKGDFDPLLANRILTERVLVPSSRCLAFCFARTCDLRCVMGRRLMCVYPRRLLRSGTYVTRAYVMCMCIARLLAHPHSTRCNVAVRIFTNTFRTSR